MKQQFSDEIRMQMQKRIACTVWAACGVTAVGCGLMLLLSLAGEFYSWEALIAALIMAAVFIVDYWLVQKHYLPLARAVKLLQWERGFAGEEQTGTFLGYAETLGYHSGVLMRRMKLDCGMRFRNESLITEVEIPACIGQLPLTVGTEITVCTSHNVVTGYSAQCAVADPRVDIKRAGYHVSGAVCALAVLISGVFWYCLYGKTLEVPREEQINVAVCTVARGNFGPDAAGDEMQQYGIRQVGFSYLESSDVEQAAQYLATYAVMDADIILMSAFLFEEALYSDGYPLTDKDIQLLNEQAGVQLKLCYDPEGKPNGIVLFDPEDAAYSEQFPILHQWLMFDKSDRYVLTVSPCSEQPDTSLTLLAAGHLLAILTGR